MPITECYIDAGEHGRQELTKTTDALKSLFGAKDRKQTILTPKSITDYVRECFGGTIALDPCPYFGTEDNVKAETTSTDGLMSNWVDRTYVNPPFKTLRPWLEKACEYKEERIIVLAPVRTHRKWFRETMRKANAVLLLDPVTFVGYDQVFPAPLCLLLFNTYPLRTPLGEFAWTSPISLQIKEQNFSKQLEFQF